MSTRLISPSGCIKQESSANRFDSMYVQLVGIAVSSQPLDYDKLGSISA